MVNKVDTKHKAYKRKVEKIFTALKNEIHIEIPPITPIYAEKKLLGYLRAVTKDTLNNPAEIRRLAKWRRQSEWWFPSQFKVTVSGTAVWVEDRLLNIKDRFLFIIDTPSGEPIGHVGLFRFNFQERACEVDNVIRGENHIPGIMTYAIEALIQWAKKYLGVKKVYLEVFSDNERAIALYERCGFVEVKRVPMKKAMNKTSISWVEDTTIIDPERLNVYMQYFHGKYS